MDKYCPACVSKITDESNLCRNCGCSLDISNDTNQLQPGTILNNRYYIGKAIGAGGFGITYISFDTLLESKVAVKEFFPSQAATRVSTISPNITIVKNSSGENERIYEKGQENFLVEARTVAKFKNISGIVNVLDIFNENNTSYIVMDYLEGETLNNYIKNHGDRVSYIIDNKDKTVCRISYNKALDMLLPVIKALANVHNEDIIHRDISPDNIMIYNDKGTLFDFGAARNQTSDVEKSLTVILKYGYAPLEQHRRNGKQGPWTDVYAICATIYHAITGVAPVDVLDRLEKDELPLPSSFGINIPQNIENAIMKGLSVNYQKRQQTVQELISDINADAKDYVVVEKPKPITPVPPKPMSTGKIELMRTVTSSPVTTGTSVQMRTVTSGPVATATPKPKTTAAPQPKPAETLKPKKKKSKIKIFLLVVIILLILYKAIANLGEIGFFGNKIDMVVNSKLSSTSFNKDEFSLDDYYLYVHIPDDDENDQVDKVTLFCDDGDAYAIEEDGDNTYSLFIEEEYIGDCTIKAFDESGNVLASKKITIYED